jgi:hypothetical protein
VEAMLEDKRSCRDKIDWTEIDQLHAATLQLSNSCYEYKKICVTFLGVAVTALAAITKGIIDNNYFIISIFIILGFWISDAISYYYQRKLRGAMNIKLTNIAKRNDIKDYSMRPIKASRINALFNPSMILYYIFLGLSICGWLLYYNQKG